MPLIHSPSKKAFKENLKAELEVGRPQKQALAIAYSVQREALESIIESFASKITGSNLRTIGNVAGKLPLTGQAGLLAKGIQAGAEFQADLIDPEEDEE